MSYTWEYVRNENSEITDILVNGKSVEKSHLNAFLKAQKTSYFKLYEEDGEFFSPHNFMPYKLNGLELTLVNWTYKFQDKYNRWSKGFVGDLKKMKSFTEAPIQTFDRIRELVRSLPSSTYMDLID